MQEVRCAWQSTSRRTKLELFAVPYLEFNCFLRVSACVVFRFVCFGRLLCAHTCLQLLRHSMT